jgi:iron complex transport system substrate-binding protein
MANGMTIVTRHGVAFLAALAVGLAGLTPLPGYGQGITVPHAQGETALPSAPRKVFTFDLASLDTLDAIGVEVAGVPTGPKPDYLTKYDSSDYVKIGTLIEPDYEVVNAEQPDLVIVAGRSAPKFSDLSGIAPTVDLTTDAGNFVASAISNAETLGSLFGKEAEVERRVEDLRASIADLRQVASTAGRGLLVLTTGGRMSAYGPGSRFGVLYTDFGVIPAVEGLDTANHGQAISFEFILEADPDGLFVIDRDAAIGREGQTARQFLDNEIVRETTAWKKGQVVYLDPTNWYLVGGGLTALQRNVDAIRAALSSD